MDIGKIEQLSTFKAGENIVPPLPGSSSPQKGEPCRNCHARPGTELWVGEGGVLAYVHGPGVYWCRVCVLKVQLKHARKRAAEIPAMERELADLERATAPEREP